MVDENYGIRIRIASAPHLGSALRTVKGRAVSFSSVDEAVLDAEHHSRMPLFIDDWIYDIVPLKGDSYGEPIASYCSVPKFQKIVKQ